MPHLRPRRGRLSLFLTILSLFLVVALLTGAAITLGNYYQTRAAATDVAADTFDAAITRISERRSAFFSTLILFVEIYSQNPAVMRGKGAMEEVLPSILRGLRINPHVFEIYAGYENGDYYQIFSFVDDDADVIAGLGGPPETRYAVHDIRLGDDGVRSETWRFLDSEQNDIDFREDPSPAYDPRVRPWYQNARANSDGFIRTSPYVFAISPEVGMTVAKSFDGPLGGVIAADITLDRLSAFLNEVRPNRNHRLLAFESDSRIIAYTEPDQVLKRSGDGTDLNLEPALITDLRDPVIQETVRHFMDVGPFQLASLDIGGVEYLASVALQTEEGQNGHYILYAAPRSEFEGSLAGAAARSVIPGLIVILLALPAIIYLARLIARPLTRLSGEADLIRSFELKDPITMYSPVREIDALIGSMSGMKGTLREVSKFVPKALVKDILDSERHVEVGGERRHISLLFTDVENFTPISDKTPPEDLMVHMSEYFDELVALVIKEDGTVDKFVGDAIFAYWNAPLPVERYEHSACLTALKCQNISEQLCRQWAAQGRMPWRTRFGVHAGDAVVGNVGSSDRIDYTVIGDTVNIASRLEGLNKYYGTQILASGPVADACADQFMFRHVDRSLPKGAGKPLEIYELMGMYDGPDDLRITPDQAKLVVDWNIAYEAYASHDWFKALDAIEAFLARYPDDGVAKIYLERIIEFLIEPPPQDWDGIMRFSNK